MSVKKIYCRKNSKIEMIVIIKTAIVGGDGEAAPVANAGGDNDDNCAKW